MRTFKVLALLLHYPEAEVQAHAEELLAVLDDEGLIRGRARAAIAALVRGLREGDLFELQARYVETFDRGRARSLYLFEHVHGESRDRGQAMVELRRVYREHGFDIAVRELPDYLPLFLEFLSTVPVEEAAAWLEELGELLQLLHARLRQHESPYAVLFEPLLALADVDVDDPAVREQVRGEAADDTPEALDRVWREEPVTFGPDTTCGQVRTKPRTEVPLTELTAGRSASSPQALPEKH